MIQRLVVVTLCVCLLSSFALADNPTDAPLNNSDPTSVVAKDSAREERKCTKRKDASQLHKTAGQTDTSRVGPDAETLTVPSPAPETRGQK